MENSFADLFPYLHRRNKNSVDEYEPGRMCHVLEINADIYFANYIQDNIEKDFWFADVENNVVFKAKEHSTVTANRIAATTNSGLWQDKIYKIPSGFSKQQADFVFLEYDMWVDTCT